MARDRTEYHRKWVTENSVYYREHQRLYRLANAESRREYERSRNREFRRQVLEHYGNICECCGEDILAFLCIDHINGGGNVHRKETGVGSSLCKWIVKSGFPTGFRTLCQNCNFSSWVDGQCAHQGPPTKQGGHARYDYHKQKRNELRREVLEHYSPTLVCECCGLTRFEFLTIDHIDGGGKKHQRAVGRGSTMYEWIRRNWPDGLQVLCHNCNFGKRDNSSCPHKRMNNADAQ